MLNRLAVLILTVLAMFTLAACGSQPQQQTPPQQDQFALDRYPLIAEKRAMTDAELQRLGLHRSKLTEPTLLFNHHRELCRRPGDVCGKWETLPAGTEVAKDQSGRSWYKIDCANRLFIPWTCPVCQTPIGWWPFGEGGPQWPWYLPWLLFAALGALAWWLWPRSKNHDTNQQQLDPDPRSTQLPGLGSTMGASGVAAAAGMTAATAPIDQLRPPVPTNEEKLKSMTEEAKAAEKKVGDHRKAMADLQNEANELRNTGKRGDGARKDLDAEREEATMAVAETEYKKIQDEITGIKAKIAAKKSARARVIEKVRTDLAAAIATEDETAEERAMRRLRAFDVVK